MKLSFDDFKKMDKREINKTIAEKLGFICDDNWEYNQNAMRDGKESRSWANLTLLRNSDDKYFSHIGWNPFDSADSALGLIIDFGLQLDLTGFKVCEAKEFITYHAYMKSIG